MRDQGSIGERVRTLRLSRRLSQAQLAGPNLSDSYISLIESGKRVPTPTVITLLAERLGCSSDYLWHGLAPTHHVETELAVGYAELELRHGDAQTAYHRFCQAAAAADGEIPLLAARARLGRAAALEQQGELEHAIAVYEELRAEAERHPERIPWLPVAIALCRCYREAGDLVRGRELGEQARRRVNELGLEYGNETIELAVALLGSPAEEGWEPAERVKAADLAERILTAMDSKPCGEDGMVTDLWRASLRAAEQGRLAEALTLSRQALSADEASRFGTALVRLRQAYAHHLLTLEPPQPAKAQQVLSNAGATVRDPVMSAVCDIEAARAYVLAGDPRRAIHAAEKALVGLDAAPRWETAAAHVVLGLARLTQNDRQGALTALRAAGENLDRLPASRQVARVWRQLGDAYGSANEPPAMMAAYRRALECVGLRAVAIEALQRATTSPQS